jgi:hypothetical protein
MKWGTFVVIAWLVLTAVLGAAGRQSTPPAAHDAEETAVGGAAAAAMNGDACWEDYVERAIQIYLSLVECVRENEWYDAFGYLICELSYEFGAFMAFMRLMACINA